MKCKKMIFIVGMFIPFIASSSTNMENNTVQNRHNIIIIGHRGYPGVMPEETLPSYQAAATSGTNYLELDLHMTRDCQLIARHNPWMKDNTNVEEVPDSSLKEAHNAGTLYNYSLAKADRKSWT
ncbi:hypothetical protein ABWE39_005463 [Salmonella enterica subsp. enterica]